MREITFPSFFKMSNSYIAVYSESVCISTCISYDSKLVTVTVLELKSLNLGTYTSVLIPIAENEFLKKYMEAQNMLSQTVFTHHIIASKC